MGIDVAMIGSRDLENTCEILYGDRLTSALVYIPFSYEI